MSLANVWNKRATAILRARCHISVLVQNPQTGKPLRRVWWCKEDVPRDEVKDFSLDWEVFHRDVGRWVKSITPEMVCNACHIRHVAYEAYKHVNANDLAAVLSA